jgi:hypothetical protein
VKSWSALDLIEARKGGCDLVCQLLLNFRVSRQIKERSSSGNSSSIRTSDDEGFALAKELIRAVSLACLGVHSLEQVVEKVGSAATF